MAGFDIFIYLLHFGEKTTAPAEIILVLNEIILLTDMGYCFVSIF